MAKKRMIHRSLWKSETLATCDMTTRLLFIGIITNADDQGRMLAHPALLRSEIFPFDDVALKTIEHGLRLLADQKSLICYTAGGKALAQVAHWWEYQQPSWAWPSDLPPPPGWTDRIRRRQGNKVIKSNWKEDETDANSNQDQAEAHDNPEPDQDELHLAQTPPDDELTATPPPRHHGPTVSPPVGSAPSGSGSTSRSGSGSRSKSSPPRKKPRAGPAPPGPDDEIYHALLAFGVDGAAEIAAAYDGDDILAWLRYAREKRDDLANPQGLVVRRLQQGRKPPPAYYESPEDWRRFTNGDYAGYLEAEGPDEGTCPGVPPEGSTGLCRSLVEGPVEGDPA